MMASATSPALSLFRISATGIRVPRITGSASIRSKISSGIGRSHTAVDFGALLPLDHADVILALQVQPELRAVAEITAQPNGRVRGDCATAIQYIGDTA